MPENNDANLSAPDGGDGGMPPAGSGDDSGNNGVQGSNPPAATPPKGQTPDKKDSIAPEDQAIIDQFGGDITKIAQSKRNSDSEFGKFRTQSVQSFTTIVQANPEAIHSIPESLRDIVAKEVWGKAGIESYDQLKQKTSPENTDPLQESQKESWINDQQNDFFTEMGIAEEEKTDVIKEIATAATNLIASSSPLLGEDKTLKNALKVAFLATPKGQQMHFERGKAIGLESALGKTAANLNIPPSKMNAEDVKKSRREAMLQRMGGVRKPIV